MSTANPTVVFLTVLTFLASIGGAVIVFGRLQLESPTFWIAALAYMQTPALSSLVAQRVTGVSVPVVSSFRWSALCAFCGVGLVVLAIVATVAAHALDSRFALGWGVPAARLASLPGPEWLTPPWRLAGALVGAALVGGTVNSVAAFGEEYGWRGFLYVTTRQHGFWFSSVLVGVVWGAWHTPVIVQGLHYRGRPLVGVLFFVALCTLLAPIFTRLRDAGAPATAVAAMHGSINAAAGLAVILFGGTGDSEKVGLLGVPGLVVLLALDVSIALWPKG